MASEEETTSDSCNVSIRPVPKNLLPYVRSRVLHYVNEAKDFSAEIHQTSETDARLVFYHGTEFTEQQERVSSADDNTNTVTDDKIIVKNIPRSVDEDILEVFFESAKKVGAGPVKSVQLNREKNWAIIEFCEAGAVEAVMNKKPLTLLDTTLDIHPYEPLLQADESINGVEIRGLPSELTNDILLVQTDGISDSYAASYILEAVAADDPLSSMVTEEETISNLKPVQLKMLSVTKFHVTEEQKCPNVKVKIDHSKNDIVFKGDKADIMHTKLHMFETLSNFSTRVLNISENHAELFGAKHVQQYIAEKLQSEYPVCTWEAIGSELMICSSEADIESCVKIIFETVREVIMPLNCESLGVLLTHKWPTKLTDLHKEGKFIYKMYPSESHTSICIITTDDIVNEVVNIVHEFLWKHASIKTETFSEDTSFGNRLVQSKRQCPNLIMEKAREIEKYISMHFVSIDISRCNVKVSGTLRGIESVKDQFTRLL